MFASLMTILGAYLLIRTFGMVATTPGTGLLSLNVLVWVKNVAMILAATLFFGNTVPIAREGSLVGVAWMVSNATLVGLALGYGLWVGHREAVRGGSAGQRAISPVMAGWPAHSGFLSVAFVATFFPMVLMKHISEIYLSPVIFALALLIGLSAQGWTAASRPLRYVALFLAASQLVLAASAIQAKVAGIRDAGERTDVMMQQLLHHLPRGRTPDRVAIVFLNEGAAGGKSYSVFAMPDEQLILSGYGNMAIRWYRPDLAIRLDQLVVNEPSEVHLESYDLVLLWEPSTRQFRPIKRPASRL